MSAENSHRVPSEVAEELATLVRRREEMIARYEQVTGCQHPNLVVDPFNLGRPGDGWCPDCWALIVVTPADDRSALMVTPLEREWLAQLLELCQMTELSDRLEGVPALWVAGMIDRLRHLTPSGGS